MSDNSSAASPEADEVDSILREWRQGDVATAESAFCFSHLQESAEEVARIEPGFRTEDGEISIGLERFPTTGLVVLTQTCDIARGSADRPYVEVCPLVTPSEQVLKDTELGTTPQYVHIPGAAADQVANLSIVLTLHKRVLASLKRTPGWSTDDEIRRIQATIARRYQRFAFPDDLHRSLKKFSNRLRKKYGQQPLTAEGELFRRVLQIRAQADPNWQSDEISVKLSFILPSPLLEPVPQELIDEELILGTNRWLNQQHRESNDVAARLLGETNECCESLLWAVLVERWVELAEPEGVIADIEGEVASESEYCVRDYWASDRLDLDHLSDYQLQY